MMVAVPMSFSLSILHIFNLRIFFLSRLSGYYWLKNDSLLYVFEQFPPNPALVVIVLRIGNSRYCMLPELISIPLLLVL